MKIEAQIANKMNNMTTWPSWDDSCFHSYFIKYLLILLNLVSFCNKNSHENNSFALCELLQHARSISLVSGTVKIPQCGFGGPMNVKLQDKLTLFSIGS